jgi:inner membrane protein
VGVAAGQMLMGRRMSWRFWTLAAMCPAIPDADVISFSLGIPYEAFFGHRGFFHSLTFAAILAAVVVHWEFHDRQPFSRPWWGMFGFFFLIIGSHGVLDALTDGGLGIALFSPFYTIRYFFPWTPIMVAPIGIVGFFSDYGLEVLLNEAKWVWLPTTALLVLVWGLRAIPARARRVS